MITYSDLIEGIVEDQLQGFFVGWKKIPPPSVQLEAFKNSRHVIVARDSSAADKIIGFVTALSDGVMTAYIPLLEVLPEYQGQGIGSKLMRLMLEKLEGMYMIDLLCDADTQAFYERLGMRKTTGMMTRNMHG